MTARAIIVSFRLGGTDGVSVEAAKWAWALRTLGWQVTTVAGEGRADVMVDGLARYDRAGPSPAALERALAGADLVVVENACSLPLNPEAADALCRVLEDRPTLLHHHDLPWQRPAPAPRPTPPSGPTWLHVAASRISAVQLEAAGVAARVLPNFFSPLPPGRRERTRAALGLEEDTPLLLQPTRAIARKAIEVSISLARSLKAMLWLLGEAEDGYGAVAEALLQRPGIPVARGLRAAGGGTTIADAFSAADAVSFPSRWEGFGNPPIEAALARLPAAVGDYPVARELRSAGFEWFDPSRPSDLAAWLAAPDPAILEGNFGLAERYFSLGRLPGRLHELLASWPALAGCALPEAETPVGGDHAPDRSKDGRRDGRSTSGVIAPWGPFAGPGEARGEWTWRHEPS